MDLRAFANRMTVISTRIEPNAHKVVQRTGLAVDQTVVMGTPVDTGRARANWQVQAGVAPSGVIEPPATTPTANTQAALEQGKIAISNAPPGLELHITNNLSYIGKLNDGHSAQAPAGYVEQAISAGVATIRQARLIE